MLVYVPRALAACLAFQIAAGGAAHSQIVPAAAQALTLANAIDLALARNPDLAASEYERRAAEGRVIQAGLRPNPELRLELENLAGNGGARGLDMLESTLRLSRVIELGGKRALRQAVAQADRGLVEVEQRARELDVLAEVSRRFVAVVAGQERARYAQAATALARQTLEALTRRVDAARSPVAEQSRARIALTRAELAQRQAASELGTARYALAALWGDAEPAFSAAAADLFRMEGDETFRQFFDRLERTPQFLAFASEARLRDAELRLEQAQARQNVAVDVGIRRFEASDDFALVAGISKPIGARNRNQGAILEARARRAQTAAERDAALTRARATLIAVYRQMTTARERAETLRSDAIPQAETALRQTQAGYDAGRFSFLELATTEHELLELQQSSVDAAADYHLLRSEIERLTNEPLSTSLEAPRP